ncbi:MAG: ParB N-terminal domain-containing protein [Colwellia sp.]|nr:ParB N-terminal domain-containing protein [Colwellia sp.]
MFSKKNVRKKKPSTEGIKRLSANIAAKGIMQNLIVIENKGKLEVIAGRRRLMALFLLLKKNVITEDYPVPARVITDAELATSLAENIQRENMHPVDEFEAFQCLFLEEGMNEKEIANEFGIAVKYVQQQMKLALVHSELRKLCRTGDLDLDCLMAFTVTDDIDRQWQVFQALPSHSISAYGIKKALCDGTIRSDDNLVKYIGLSAYKKAGGATVADLFDSVDYLQDGVLVHELASKKLSDDAKDIEARCKWVEFSLSVDWNLINQCGMVERVDTEVTAELLKKQAALELEINELEDIDEPTDEEDTINEKWDECSLLDDEIEASRMIKESDKLDSGCVISIDDNGCLKVRDGLIHPNEMKQRHKAAQVASEGRVGYAGDKDQPKFTKSLIEDLWCHRLMINKLYLAQNHEVAFDVMLYNLFISTARAEFHQWLPSSLDIRVQNTFKETSLGDVQATDSYQGLMKIKVDMLKSISSEGKGVDLYRSIKALSSEVKNELFALIVSESLSTPRDDSTSELFLEIENDLNLSLREHWKPTAENLFNRVGKDTLVDWGKSLSSEWTASSDKVTKKVMAGLLDNIFNQPVDTLNAVQKEKLDSWLPECFE